MKNLNPPYLKFFVYNNAWVAAMDTLATGSLLTAYALALGAGHLVIGLLAAIPYFGSLFNIFGAYGVKKGKNAKKIALITSLASRPFYLLCAGLAFCTRLPDRSLWLLLLIAFCYASGGISAGAYYPWLKQTLPDSQTHLFVRQKYLYAMGIHILCFLFAFFFFRIFTLSDGFTPLPAYAFIFFLAFVFGTAASLFLLPIPAPENRRFNSSFSLSALWADPNSRGLFLLCTVGYFSSVYLFAFLPVFLLKFLNFSVVRLTFFALLSQIAFLLSLIYWKKLNEKKGPVFSAQSSFAGLTILLILLTLLLPSLPSCKWVLLVFSGVLFICAGMAQAGIQAGLDTTILLKAPKENSPLYFALVALVKTGAGLGALFGGFWLNTVSAFSQQETTAWQLFFLFGFFLSLLALLCSKFSLGKIK